VNYASSFFEKVFLGRLVKNIQMQGTRNSEEWGVLFRYAAMTKDKRNAADGCFSPAC
jgi:hypothetical protein